MTSWEYSSSYFNTSWAVPFAVNGRRLTGTLSLRSTIDRQASLPLSQPNERDHHMYEELGQWEIRLLHLHPGEYDSDLSGTFSVVQLHPSEAQHRNTAYEALSYVWGSVDYQCYFNVGGLRLEILPNLADALRAIRSRSQVRKLWIDAMCINQHDLGERSHQVTRMDEIYRQASQVLVWLGRSTAESAISMQMLFHMKQGYSSGRKFWQAIPPNVLRSAVDGVLERPYFSRMWVVQEAALANKVVLICGDDSFSWENNVETVFRFLQSLKLASIAPGWPHRLNLDAFVDLLEKQLLSGPDATLWGRRKQQGIDALSIAYSLRNRQVTEPRDRIFGLLGLLNRDDAQHFQPDYTVGVEETYDKFVRMVEKNSGERIVGLTQRTDTPNSLRPDAETPLITETSSSTATAQSICLQAVQLMNSGELGEASRLLGRATILLHSDLHTKQANEASLLDLN